MLRVANICPKEILQLAGYQSINPRFASTVAVRKPARLSPPSTKLPSAVPRYIRRQALAEQYAARVSLDKKKGVGNDATETTTTGAANRPTKLLEPHVLSARLKKLCDAGKIDDAITALKNAPLDAQNVPVWNTLIWECMKAQKYASAYKLFTDMKRRGHSPNTRTYQTMFSGLSRMENWMSHTKQLTNAHALYDYFIQHITSVKKHDPTSSQLSTLPLSYYIKILGDTGHIQNIFDVYYALDGSVNLAPDQYIYTAMFSALAGKKLTEQGNAAFDAKLLWSQMLKASQKSPGFEVDVHLVTAAISALSRGSSSDQSFAFNLLREYFGITKPTDPPSPVGLLPLTPPALAAALHLCNISGEHRLALHFLRQVTDRPERHGGVSVIDRHHVEEVLRACVSLSTAGSVNSPYPYEALQTLEWMLKREFTAPRGQGVKLRPAASTYNLVLSACWRGSDWDSCMSAFQMMTGYHVADFSDKHVLSQVNDPMIAPRIEKRSAGRNLKPDAETLSTILRTANATKNRAHIRQALRIVDHFGLEDLGGVGKDIPSRKQVKRGSFYQSKLAEAILASVEHVLGRRKPSSTKAPTEEPKEAWNRPEAQRWRDLERQAVQFTSRSSR